MQPSEILQQMQDYIAEHGWHQGSMRGEDGAVCLSGAYYGLGGDTDMRIPAYLLRAVGIAIPRRKRKRTDGGWPAVVRFNDSKLTNYEDVQLVIKQARELAELDERPLEDI